MVRDREKPLYSALAVGYGYLWAAHHILPLLVRVDPVTMGVTEVRIEDKALCIAPGHGAVWVATTRSLVRIEPSLAEVQTVTSMEWTGPNAVGGKVAEAAIGVDADAVWVGGIFQEALRRVDPASGRVTATPPVTRSRLGLAVGHGAVWVRDGDVIRRLDPVSWEVVSTIRPRGRPDRILATDEGIWVQVATDVGTTVVLLDPRTEKSIASLDFDVPPLRVHVRNRTVWSSFPVQDEPGNRSIMQRVVLANPTSVLEIDVDRAIWALAVDDTAVWATTFRNKEAASRLLRIDYETGTIETKLDFGSVDLTPYLPPPVEWPPSRLEDEGVFACAACGLVISQQVGPLPAAPPVPENEVGEYERIDDWVPIGRYFMEVGDSPPCEEARGAFVLNEVDILNTQPDPTTWHGCCGGDGMDGPNLRCANGHMVALQKSDCWTVNAVWLLPHCVRSRAAHPSDPT